MSVTTLQGQPVRVKRLKAGDHFGYDALLSDRHDTTVTCLTSAELTAVPERELKMVNDTYFKSTVEARREARGKALWSALWSALCDAPCHARCDAPGAAPCAYI